MVLYHSVVDSSSSQICRIVSILLKINVCSISRSHTRELARVPTTVTVSARIIHDYAASHKKMDAQPIKRCPA